jgi:hypothetical protein
MGRDRFGLAAIEVGKTINDFNAIGKGHSEA